MLCLFYVDKGKMTRCKFANKKAVVKHSFIFFGDGFEGCKKKKVCFVRLEKIIF